MKLSAMTTNEAADVLISITPDIGEILQDVELIAKFQDKTDNVEDAISRGVQIAVYSIPVLLGKYRKNMFNIVGAVNHKTHEEIGNQMLQDTINEITEIFEDERLLSFFRQFAV